MLPEAAGRGQHFQGRALWKQNNTIYGLKHDNIISMPEYTDTYKNVYIDSIYNYLKY